MSDKPESTVPDVSRELTGYDFLVLGIENIKLLTIFPLVIGAIALALTFALSPTYTASARILPPIQPQSTAAIMAAQIGSVTTLGGWGLPLKNPADQYVSLLKSRSVQDAVINRFELKQLYGTAYQIDARRILNRNTSISLGAKDGIITIEVEDQEANRAAQIANAFVEELQKLSRTLAITEAGQRRLFFQLQLDDAKRDLEKSELALRESGVGEAALKTLPQSTLESLGRLKAQITAQELRLASLRLSMTPTNPVVVQAVEELIALRNELRSVEQANPAKAAGAGSAYLSKFREYKFQEALFELVSKQYEAARLDEAREGAVIQILDSAEVAEKPSGPQRVLISAVTAMSVFMLALIFVLLKWMLLNSLSEALSAKRITSLRHLLRRR